MRLRLGRSCERGGNGGGRRERRSWGWGQREAATMGLGRCSSASSQLRAAGGLKGKGLRGLGI